VFPLPGAVGADRRAIGNLVRHVREGWDIIHAHDARAVAMMVYIQALVGSQAALVASRRSSAPPSSSGPMSRWHRADIVLAVSGPARDALIHAGIERRRVRIVPNCVVAEEIPDGSAGILRSAVGAAPEHRLIASFTGLTAHRDHETFIQAAALLRDRVPEARFVILGRGPERRALEDMIDEYELAKRVCLPGHLSNARQYLGEIDVFVMPSLRQEITSACLEAMAAGVPVILPAADSGRDRAGTAAETFPPRDPEALAVALERLLVDSSYRDAVSRRGREFALGHGPPALIRRTLTAYRAVLQRQRNSSL
jgi:glycosyltransferase involved in cell wall biosynthesis